jgi:hypothetical protein
MSKLLSVLALSAALLLPALAASPAQAEDRRVKVINETSFTLVKFYASNVGTNSWEEDILGADTIPPGGSFVANIDDGTGYCKFDFKGVFDDGDEVVKNGIDVCETAVFRFTE